MGNFFVKVQFLKALIPQKACGLDYILVVILSTVILNFHYQLNSSIRVCKDVFFRNCCKVYEVHVYEKNGNGSAANKYCHASLLFVDSKIFEKLPNNVLVNHIKKLGPFPKFQYGFKSFQSTADLLTDVSNRTGRAFYRFGAAQTISLDISKTFAKISHKLKFYRILGQVFGHISHFLDNRRFGVVLAEKFLQKVFNQYLSFSRIHSWA